MLQGPGRSTYVFRSEAPLWVRSFLERIAEALARAPSGHALLIEQLDGGRYPQITAARPEFEPTLTAVARSLPGVWSPVPRAVGPAWTWDHGTQVGFLTRRPRGEEEAERPAPRAPAVRATVSPRDAPLGLDVQAHWFPDTTGRLRVWTRFVASRGGAGEAALLYGGLELARSIEAAGEPAVDVRIERRWLGAEAEWSTGRLGRLRRGPPLELAPIAAAASVPLVARAPEGASDPVRHTVVLGATGSGKTGLVAAMAADRIARGTPVLLFDVHGDLAPAVVARLSPSHRRRVLAIDAADPRGRIPGVSILDPAPGGGAEAAAADVVAALKRLSSEGGETYWGFRLERIFDTFVRLVQDEQGSLLDLAALLTDARRRESARLTTRRPDAARFLDELPAILRRSPEFLWPAASRLSKIALVPALAALLAPSDGGLPIEEWVGGGGSLVFRLPFSHLGPEGAALAGTLLATRSYLVLARSPVRRGKRLRALFVVDEAHAFSARLLTEMLAEGRKFGIGVVIASQYPERLEPELRAAAAGAAGTHIVFRVPPAAARDVGSWIGMTPTAAVELLPALPVGQALAVRSGEPARFLSGEPLPRDPRAAWASRVDATALAYLDSEMGTSVDEPDAIGDMLLLELVGRDGADGSADESEVLSALARREVDPIDPEVAARELARLAGRGWVERTAGRVRSLPAGERRLGIGAPTGAVTESAEHRALLVEALRVLARRGLRLEILRQGRFDTRLPDAVVAIVPRPSPDASPETVWRTLESRRTGWGWRFFHGRNVHFEAEVSGAERRERIRRGLHKAERRGAFALFLVADARRARRVRAVLVDEGVFPHRAQVWTLPKARPAGPPQQPLRP
jgi:Type IV secretion-system coupling protein DNA-binding domain